MRTDPVQRQNSQDHQSFARPRARCDRAIHDVKPSGGNACLDAALKAIDMLKGVPANKAKAVVLISNGLDQYSSKDAKKKILAAAAGSHVVVHTIGIGEATRPQIVNIVLVLDHSGSMESPADDDDDTQKIDGLHRARPASSKSSLPRPAPP